MNSFLEIFTKKSQKCVPLEIIPDQRDFFVAIDRHPNRAENKIIAIPESSKMLCGCDSRKINDQQ